MNNIKIEKNYAWQWAKYLGITEVMNLRDAEFLKLKLRNKQQQKNKCPFHFPVTSICIILGS